MSSGCVAWLQEVLQFGFQMHCLSFRQRSLQLCAGLFCCYLAGSSVLQWQCLCFSPPAARVVLIRAEELTAFVFPSSALILKKLA